MTGVTAPPGDYFIQVQATDVSGVTGSADAIMLHLYAGTPIITDAVPIGSGWFNSAVFGIFYGTPPGWIYHAQHGWMYIWPTSTPSNIFIYTTDMGFLTPT